eukprot:TRINITY_DN808_c0_g4_i2.p1 TRINITY_DN808_c0_g4~~TRINITY_DN808_c0_g4_i2.p1  ORF type:complete len:332 (-),score=53.96 TRINITY_DN808_c0_g4_i2:571-1566(-)
MSEVTVLGNAKHVVGSALRRLAHVEAPVGLVGETVTQASSASTAATAAAATAAAAAAAGSSGVGVVRSAGQGLASLVNLESQVPFMPQLPLTGVPAPGSPEVCTTAAAAAALHSSANAGGASGVPHTISLLYTNPVSQALRSYVIDPISQALGLLTSGIGHGMRVTTEVLYKASIATWEQVCHHPWLTLVAMVTVAGVQWAIVKYRAPMPSDYTAPHPSVQEIVERSSREPRETCPSLTPEDSTSILQKRIVAATAKTQVPSGCIRTGVCCICMDGNNNTVYVPCGHLVTCSDCNNAYTLTQCPICRGPIEHKLILDGDVRGREEIETASG